MLHRLFVLVVVTGMFGTMGCSEPALPEELVVRLDRTVRSTDRGWMFDSVGRGKTGILFRWTRVKDEIDIRTWVFETDEEAQTRLRATIRSLSVGSKAIDNVGDLAYITGGASTQTHVYASIGNVFFDVSAPSFPDKDLAGRLAARAAQELANNALLVTTSIPGTSQSAEKFTLSLIRHYSRALYRECQLHVSTIEGFSRASLTCMHNTEPSKPLHAERTLTPQEILTFATLVRQSHLCGGGHIGGDGRALDGVLETLMTTCGQEGVAILVTQANRTFKENDARRQLLERLYAVEKELHTVAVENVKAERKQKVEE